MADEQLLRNRLVLTAGGAGALGLGAVALAGCSSGATPTAASATTTAPASTTGSAAPGSGASGSGATTSAPAATGSALATLADVPVGGAVSAELNGQPVLVAQPTAGTAVCFSAICPHQGCTVAPGSTVLACPCHGSTFDTATGAVLSGPARSRLTAVTVTVVAGAVTAS